MTENYLNSLLPDEEDWVRQIEQQARQRNVPIMEPLGIQFLMQIVRMHKPKKILEIGTGIGYSALRMLQAYPSATIITIERDKARRSIALQNLQTYDRHHQIELIYGDALEQIKQLKDRQETFQLVFIDAAKGQYQRFFELIHPLVEKAGIVVSDNVLFRGYVADEASQYPSRYKNMINKLKSYNEWLSRHPEYHTTIIPIGDGVAISYKLSKQCIGMKGPEIDEF
ncbi:MAG TPA: O-methyltransferase [Cerasibacillus sp.]|uniref:O-methyltransferase n=1 Tax=Cerasibacillus sp. TaxID=2498711 RepID=UPI002F4170F9